MSDEGTVFDLSWLVVWLVFGLIIGSVAYRKGRNPWLWGIVGGLFTIPALIVITFFVSRRPKQEGTQQ